VWFEGLDRAKTTTLPIQKTQKVGNREQRPDTGGSQMWRVRVDRMSMWRAVHNRQFEQASPDEQTPEMAGLQALQ